MIVRRIRPGSGRIRLLIMEKCGDGEVSWLSLRG
jgi:hypothetical protein